MAGGSPLFEEDQPISQINITPFVDVVLVLLVIFMATAGIIVNRGLKLNLPQASTTEPLTESQQTSFALKNNGELYIDGIIKTTQELQFFLQQNASRLKDQVVLIGAEKEVPYNTVIQLLDHLRQQGINDFALQLEVPKKD